MFNVTYIGRFRKGRRLYTMSLFMRLTAISFILAAGASLIHSSALADSFKKRAENAPACPFDGLKDTDLNVKTFKSYFAKHAFKTTDEFVPCLPESMRSNFSLMYQSASLQGEVGCVDSDHPRIIFYGNNAQLMLAVTGHTERPECNKIEALEFNPQGAAIEAREFTFSPQGDGHPHTSSKNPTLCLRCHTSDPRPIWESYDLWPGAYGSNDDDFPPTQITDVIRKYAGVDGGIDAYLAQHPLAPRPTRETSMFMQFIQKNRDKGPYASLVWKNDPLEDQPSLFADSLDTKDGAESYRRNRPNARFSRLITKINVQRLARKIRESKNYEKYKYLIAALFGGCSAPSGSKVPTPLHGVSWKKASTQAIENQKQYDAAKESRARIVIGIDDEKYYTRRLVHMSMLSYGPEEVRANSARANGGASGMHAESARVKAILLFAFASRRIDISGWSTAVEKNDPAFEDGTTAFGIQLFEELKKTDSDVNAPCEVLGEKAKNFFPTAKPISRTISKSECVVADLSTGPAHIDKDTAKIVDALGNASRQPKQLPVPASCIHCHDPGRDQAPTIPFKNRSSLARALSKDKGLLKRIQDRTQSNSALRMPPKASGYPVLNESERAQLVEYLRALER